MSTMRGDGLAVADDDGVEEGRDGLRVRGRGPAREHEGIGLRAVGRCGGGCPEVEHQEDVGEGELELQREAHGVEVAQGAGGLQRDQREERSRRAASMSVHGA
jgi:hypothetical protein